MSDNTVRSFPQAARQRYAARRMVVHNLRRVHHVNTEIAEPGEVLDDAEIERRWHDAQARTRKLTEADLDRRQAERAVALAKLHAGRRRTDERLRVIVLGVIVLLTTIGLLALLWAGQGPTP